MCNKNLDRFWVQCPFASKSRRRGTRKHVYHLLLKPMPNSIALMSLLQFVDCLECDLITSVTKYRCVLGYLSIKRSRCTTSKLCIVRMESKVEWSFCWLNVYDKSRWGPHSVNLRECSMTYWRMRKIEITKVRKATERNCCKRKCLNTWNQTSPSRISFVFLSLNLVFIFHFSFIYICVMYIYNLYACFHWHYDNKWYLFEITSAVCICLKTK